MPGTLLFSFPENLLLIFFSCEPADTLVTKLFYPTFLVYTTRIWVPIEQNPYVLNHVITEGECKQSWFTCVHKYFWSKPYPNVWRKILEKRIKSHRNQTWREKVDYVFVNFWLLNTEARLHTRLEQYGFPVTFFEVKFAQNLNENRLCNRHWVHGV